MLCRSIADPHEAGPPSPPMRQDDPNMEDGPNVAPSPDTACAPFIEKPL